MIISASRRTDIPAYYSSWFVNRIKEKYLLVRNPMNIYQVSRINLNPEVVDGIVFWTKNPIPIINKLDYFKDYTYYFQITISPYASDIEKNLPSKDDVLIPAFIDLSKKLGKECTVWRYDPIFVNQIYTLDFHKKKFEEMAKKLAGYTEKCTISFLDLYQKTERNIKPYNIRTLNIEEQLELMEFFSNISKKYDFYIDTCAEGVDLSQFGIKHACCIEKERFEKIGKYELDVKKDNQRENCGCISCIDIGMYNTCKNGCVYCYANYNEDIVENQTQQHDENSPLLFGKVDEKKDVIKDRKMVKYRKYEKQLSLFDIIK